MEGLDISWILARAFFFSFSPAVLGGITGSGLKNKPDLNCSTI